MSKRLELQWLHKKGHPMAKKPEKMSNFIVIREMQIKNDHVTGVPLWCSGLRIQCCHCRVQVIVVVQVWSLSWELPHVTSTTKNKQTNKQTNPTMWYRSTHIRMSKMTKISWWGYGAAGTLIYCCWYKLIQSFGKSNIIISFNWMSAYSWPSNSSPTEMLTYIQQREVPKSPSFNICNSPK